jgi:hypothetical protein
VGVRVAVGVTVSGSSVSPPCSSVGVSPSAPEPHPVRVVTPVVPSSASSRRRVSFIYFLLCIK